MAQWVSSTTYVSPHAKRMAELRRILDRMDGTEASRIRIQQYMNEQYKKSKGYYTHTTTGGSTCTVSTYYSNSTKPTGW